MASMQAVYEPVKFWGVVKGNGRRARIEWPGSTGYPGGVLIWGQGDWLRRR